MYLPKAVAEYNMAALDSAMSNLARVANISVAVFNADANFIAGTQAADVQDWTDRLKRRLKVTKLYQTDLFPLEDGMAIAASPIMSENDLIGYIMVGIFYYSSTGRTHKPPEFDYPVFNAERVHATVDLAKTCVLSSCAKIIRPNLKLGERMKQFIYSNLDKPLNSRYLGEQFGMPSKAVREFFSEAIGRSVLSYIASERVGAAQRLLWQSDLPIEAVAQRVGLTEAQLCKGMRRYWIPSPEEYRQHKRDVLGKKLPVAFVINDDYAPYLSTAIYSLTSNRDPKKEYAIIIFHTGLSLKNIEILKLLETSRVEIEFVDLEEQLRPYEELFRTCAHYTKETYYRLFIPTFLGKFFDRFVYLDADLVVNDDISKLFEEADPEKTVSAVLNYSTKEDADYIRSLGLDPESYVNAGVMVVDCKRYLQANYFEKAIECLRRQETYQYVDQDVLNLICRDDIGILQPSWNVQWNNLGDSQKLIPSVRDLLAFVQPPRIVHYTIEKPWKVMLNDYGKYYQRYVAQNRVLERFETEQ